MQTACRRKVNKPCLASLSSRVGFLRVGSCGDIRSGWPRASQELSKPLTGTWQFLAVTGRAAEFASASPSQNIKYASDQESSRNRKHLGENWLGIMATCACLLPEMVAGLNSLKGNNHTVQLQRMAVKSLGGQYRDSPNIGGGYQSRTQSCLWHSMCTTL